MLDRAKIPDSWLKMEKEGKCHIEEMEEGWEMRCKVIPPSLSFLWLKILDEAQSQSFSGRGKWGKWRPVVGSISVGYGSMTLVHYLCDMGDGLYYFVYSSTPREMRQVGSWFSVKC